MNLCRHHNYANTHPFLLYISFPHSLFIVACPCVLFFCKRPHYGAQIWDNGSGRNRLAQGRSSRATPLAAA